MKKNFVLITIIIGILGLLTLYKRNSPPIDSHNNGKRKSLIVGTSADYPPFSYIEKGTIVGFDIDIVNEIARRLHKQVVIHNVEFEALIPEIQLGKVDIIAAGLTITPERAQRVFFSEPYLQGPLVAITKVGSPAIKKIEDLVGKHLVVNEGYTADLYISSKNGMTIDRLSSVSDAFLALNSGHADVFISARNTIKPFLKQFGADAFNFYTIEDFDENNALAISKQRPDLLPMIQKALDNMQQDGTLNELKKKWDLL